MKKALYYITIVAVFAGVFASSCKLLLFQGSGDHATAQSVICRIKLSDPVKPSTPKLTYQVRQFSDTNGFVKEYSLTLKTSICYDKVCNPIHVNVHWDMLGRFLRLQCAKHSPLTKNEHDLFTVYDYARLDEILKDRDSILKKYKPSFFADMAKKPNSTDAVTSATPQSVQNAVVKDAAHTSWALWHWVNGESAGKLLNLTRLNCDAAFLHHCLSSPNDRDIVKFALQFILKNQPKNVLFHDDAFNILKNAGWANCVLALEYLKGSVTDKETLHEQLAQLMGVNGGSQRLISNYFAAEPHLSPTILERLAASLTRLSYREFIAVFNLLESRQCNTMGINSKISELLQSDDPYRVKYAQDYLEKQKY